MKARGPDGEASRERRADFDVSETADSLVTVRTGARTRGVAVGRDVARTGRALERDAASNVLADATAAAAESATSTDAGTTSPWEAER